MFEEWWDLSENLLKHSHALGNKQVSMKVRGGVGRMNE